MPNTLLTVSTTLYSKSLGPIHAVQLTLHPLNNGSPRPLPLPPGNHHSVVYISSFYYFRCIYIREASCSIYPSGTDFLHLASYLPGSPTLSRMLTFPLIFEGWMILYRIYTLHSIHSSVDGQVGHFHLWPSRVIPQRPWQCRHCLEILILISILLDTSQSGITGSWDSSLCNFLRNCHTDSHSSHSIVRSTNRPGSSSSPTILVTFCSLGIDILTGVRRGLIVALIPRSSMTGSFLSLRSQMDHHLLKEALQTLQTSGVASSSLICSVLCSISQWLIIFPECSCSCQLCFPHENISTVRARTIVLFFYL